MVERPLLMSAPMVQAYQRGQKGQTRRLTGLDKINEYPERWNFREVLYTPTTMVAVFENPHEVLKINFPYGFTGVTLWFRESWATLKEWNHIAPRDLLRNPYLMRWYGADGPYPDQAGRPRASIHLPRWLSRYTTLLNNLRVERLQDISEYDAQQEGVNRGILRPGPKQGWQLELNHHSKYRPGFEFTWRTLHGDDSWELNPWVWVLDLEPLTTTT